MDWIDEPGRSTFRAGLLQIYIQERFEMNSFEAQIVGYDPILQFESGMTLTEVKRILTGKAEKLLAEATKGISTE